MRDTEEILAEYNMWRRGDENFNPSPTEVGIAIDDALIQLAAIKEENERLKARVAELEKNSRVHMTMQEIADLANLAIGPNDEVTIGDNDPETEIVIYQDVTLYNEDGTCTTWPLAFYWVDCPEEGFTGIGDDPGAKPIKEPKS